MEKILALMLTLSLLTVSCNKSDGGSSDSSSTPSRSEGDETNTPAEPDPTPEPDPAPEPEPEPDPDPVVDVPEPEPSVPALALSYKTNVTYLSGFDDNDIIKYNKAVALVKKVVATEAFKDQILNHTYNGEKTFVQNNGLTNAQIYQSILDAAEKLQPAKNNTMDVGVKLYYENNSVVGYTNTSITYINVNTKYFDTYNIDSVAGNLFHEWLHKVGYGHDYDSTARRPYSVPYAVGYMIRNIGKSFL